jgi:hypothetical protein
LWRRRKRIRRRSEVEGRREKERGRFVGRGWGGKERRWLTDFSTE